MTCSPAQLEANRRNALLSTGPRTIEGKERSRRNGLKHGLTGEGIVIPTEDAEQVQARMDALEDEMRPRTPMAGTLVGHLAVLSVRLERSAVHEAKAISHKMRRAAEDCDDERLAAAEHALSWIAHEPTTHARRLRKSPEGLALLIREMEALREDLGYPMGHRWSWHHCERFQHLRGKRTEDIPTPRAKALTEALFGDFKHLEPEDGPDLEKKERQRWAGFALLALIDDEIVTLKKLLETFDREALELDRREAAYRAIFDPSKEAILARKYEAATQRALYRALKEFREIQPAISEPETLQQLKHDRPEELGSSSPDTPNESAVEAEDSPEAEVEPVEAAGSPSGRGSSDDRSIPVSPVSRPRRPRKRVAAMR